jgi:hypothetical protein
MKILLLNMQNDKNNTIMKNTMELYQSPTSTFDGQTTNAYVYRKLKTKSQEYVTFVLNL